MTTSVAEHPSLSETRADLHAGARTLPASQQVVFNETSRVRAARHIRQCISDGIYAPGEPLPPERALSEQLQVNRGTLRSALKMLSEEGLLRSNGAPPCTECGTIMVRAGKCYSCPSCGTTSGCG